MALRKRPNLKRFIKNTVGIAMQVAMKVAMDAEANETKVASSNAEK